MLFTYEEIVGFVLVLIALCAVIVLFNNARKSLNEIRQPSNEMRQKIDSMSGTITLLDKKIDVFINRHNEDIHAIKEENLVQSRAIHVILKHEIDGNDIDALKKAENQLFDHLLDRGVNKHMATKM